MRLSSNLIGFHEEFGVFKAIDIFAEAGFDSLDFAVDFEDYYDVPNDENFYRKVKKYADEKGLCFRLAHAPFDCSFTDEGETEKRFFEICEKLRMSAIMGAEVVVVHPCIHIDIKSESDYRFMMDYNIDFYKRLLPYAEELGLKIATENMLGITENAKGILELIGALDGRISLCFDVGHAFVCGQDVAKMIKELKGHISCTHFHDNDGVSDIHTLPFYGKIEWESVMKAFAEIGYDGDLSFEAGAFVFDVPLDLRGENAKYMEKTGRYLIGRFEAAKAKQLI